MKVTTMAMTMIPMTKPQRPLAAGLRNGNSPTWGMPMMVMMMMMIMRMIKTMRLRTCITMIRMLMQILMMMTTTTIIIVILTTDLPYRPATLMEKIGPNCSAHLIKYSGSTDIPPPRMHRKSWRTDNEGGYRFPAYLPLIPLSQRRKTKTPANVAHATNTSAYISLI